MDINAIDCTADITIIEDTRQKIGKHNLKNEYWKNNNINVVRQKLEVGDYAKIDDTSIIVDTKQNIQEIIMDVTRDHKRIVKNLLLASEKNIKLIYLIENTDGVKEIDDLYKWYNWRLKKSPRALRGNQLAKILKTMETEYNTKFYFCTPDESGKRVIDLLNNKWDD